MFKRQSRKPLFPLAVEDLRVAFLFSILLIPACGREKTVNRPMVETVGGKTFNTPQPNYFPLRLAIAGFTVIPMNPNGRKK